MGRFDSQVRATSIASFSRPIGAPFTITLPHENRLQPQHEMVGGPLAVVAQSFRSFRPSDVVLDKAPLTTGCRLNFQPARRT